MKVVSRPVDAIVVFKGKNKPLPYKFRYTESDGACREIVVDRIILIDEQKFAGSRSIVYDCQSSIDD